MAAVDAIIREAETGITAYLAEQFRLGEIDPGLYAQAQQQVIVNIRQWLTDPDINRLSPGLKEGLAKAIKTARWPELVEAYGDDIKFGTAGIRGKAAMTDEELQILSNEGIDAPILKGPNTLNNIVLLLTATGVANFANDHGLKSTVIGYDSRVEGWSFAKLLSQVFLAPLLP